MWHLDLWLNGDRVSAGLTAELYFRCLFQPTGFYDLGERNIGRRMDIPQGTKSYLKRVHLQGQFMK